MTPKLDTPSGAKSVGLLIYSISSLVLAYGALLAIALTTVVGQWSGMASLLSGYLFLIAPILVGIATVKNLRIRHVVRIHGLIYQAGVWFYLMLLIVLGLALLFGR